MRFPRRRKPFVSNTLQQPEPPPPAATLSRRWRPKFIEREELVNFASNHHSAVEKLSEFAKF
jgi:hypothetical protein